MKIRILFLILLNIVFSNTVYAKEEKTTEIVNDLTESSKRFSTTPSYRALYDINIMDVDAKCDETVPSEKIEKLPKRSLFRQTFDVASQNDKEMIVHVYNVPVGTSDTSTTEEQLKDKFFSKPFKVCTSGKNQVAKSNYNRVGGLNTGVLFVPFKVRDGSLFADSLIGPYLSIKTEKLEFLTTLGVSQIAVSEIGTKEVETKTGLTYGVGISFEAAKNFDVAFLVGADHLSGSTGKEWEYQDKAWLAFSIGYNFTR